jgi:hypothetical protein
MNTTAAKEPRPATHEPSMAQKFKVLESNK